MLCGELILQCKNHNFRWFCVLLLRCWGRLIMGWEKQMTTLNVLMYVNCISSVCSATGCSVQHWRENSKEGRCLRSIATNNNGHRGWIPRTKHTQVCMHSFDSKPTTPSSVVEYLNYSESISKVFVQCQICASAIYHFYAIHLFWEQGLTMSLLHPISTSAMQVKSVRVTVHTLTVILFGKGLPQWTDSELEKIQNLSLLWATCTSVLEFYLPEAIFNWPKLQSTAKEAMTINIENYFQPRLPTGQVAVEICLPNRKIY